MLLIYIFFHSLSYYQFLCLVDDQLLLLLSYPQQGRLWETTAPKAEHMMTTKMKMMEMMATLNIYCVIQRHNPHIAANKSIKEGGTIREY